jgi:hypothetical protein
MFSFSMIFLFFISTKQSEANAVVQEMANIILNSKQFQRNICRFRDKINTKKIGYF